MKNEGVLTREHLAEAEKKLQMTGGWSHFARLEAHEHMVFEEAVKMLGLGTHYTAERVSKQVVNGTNYRFLCEARPVTHEPHEYLAVVSCHVPPGGKPTDVKASRVVL